MADDDRRFVWYELMTTDVAAAGAFYTEVIGWGARDASTSDLPYTLLTSEDIEIGGLMGLPAEATKKGAMPRWMGYVRVDDVATMTKQIRRLGGRIYVPPTDTNIGHISVVADPEMATLGLIDEMKSGRGLPGDLDQPGRVGWHELLAAHPDEAFSFYGGLFGWRKADAEAGAMESYRLFSAGDQTIGGIFAKREREPFSFWLHYFNVDDIDAATKRVKDAGGRIFEGPMEVPGETWAARCVDPQGATFAIQGKRSRPGYVQGGVAELRWSAAWGDISSQGKMTAKPGKGRRPK
ncbi:MAG TPA: VOC family protein [Bradyrhizobium sp.]|nr:VOC family protein [Bradyrhizobium sp.]